ncbi:unnamed protein product [Parnassius apollo]|uniref:(apollo) hypothetical protein n=1 Tax=Parnassius apollo TaxID=110799 RepID=A0A8S3WSA0_PARAO|nr:unnamed protein product [Parnassius apollo]
MPTTNILGPAKPRRRKNTDYTQTKQIRNTESHTATRQIPVIIQAELQRNMQAHHVARENPIFRDTEEQQDTQAHRAARENSIFRDTEQQRNTQGHRIARENPVFRDIEQRCDTQAHQIAREDSHYSQIERARDTRARQSARCNSINDWDNVKRKYFDNTKEGYNHPCSCCGRLWHKNPESNVDEIPDVNPGGTETLLDENQDLTIVMAPGEGERPISLLFDRHLEELAFIKVHCAIERKYLVNLSHSEVTRSEISRNDGRAVRPDYLFTALKKQQTIAVKNNVTTCLRKKTARGAPVFACNVLQNNFVDNLVQHDDGYRVLGGIRNSPAHWESEN